MSNFYKKKNYYIKVKDKISFEHVREVILKYSKCINDFKKLRRNYFVFPI